MRTTSEQRVDHIRTTSGPHVDHIQATSEENYQLWRIVLMFHRKSHDGIYDLYLDDMGDSDLEE